MTDVSGDPAQGLSEAEKAELLAWARSMIAAAVTGDRPPTPARVSHQPVAGCFVTLRRTQSGALRGCRGVLFRTQPVFEAVASAAQAAAVDDPRFPPVTEPELGALAIEISLLSEPVPIDPESIEIGKHGLLIRDAGHLGLLLPGVATDYAWGVPTFLDAVCAKAGLPAGAWRSPQAELLGFETTHWHEPSWPERSVDPRGEAGSLPQAPSSG